ncbi:MAG: PQQ-binding-like beta-propeller repeat protein [Pirellulales bacterium]
MRAAFRPALAWSWVLLAVCSASGADWLHFRGTDNNGIAAGDQLPTEWSAEKNVAWKAPLVGRGCSSPIVVGDLVIVTSSSGAKQDRLHVLAFDAETGERRWERQFWATGHTLCHEFSSVAAPSPASDGQRIYAFYSSNDVACLDLEGNLLWFRGLTYDYPDAANDVGMSSSPVVVGDTVVVQAENFGDSFAAGLDAKTGETRWRLPRDREYMWASPTILRAANRADDSVLMQSANHFTAVDPHSGRVKWDLETRCAGIASAVAEQGVVYLPSGGVVALQASESTGAPAELWKAEDIQPSNASLVIHLGKLYAINRAGVLTCANAQNGEILWRLRLEGSFWATPVVAGDYLYIPNDAGVCQVVKLGEKGEIVAKNPLGEQLLATPAIAGNALYLRSDAHLWKIAEQGK